MRKIMLFVGIAAMGVLYSCGNDSSVAPEPEPEPQDSIISDDTTVVIPDRPTADDMQPVLTKGKRWVRWSTDDLSSEAYVANQTIIVGGDTLIHSFGYMGKETMPNGVLAKKIVRVNSDGTTTLDRIALEAGSKVYKYGSDLSQKEFWLDYDCYAVPGSVISDGFYNFVAVSRGIITLQGKQRRCTKIEKKYIHLESLTVTDYWVEGIGPLWGLTRNFSDIKPTSSRAIPQNEEFGRESWPFYSVLLECYDGDELIYDYHEFSPDLYVPLDTDRVGSFDDEPYLRK